MHDVSLEKQQKQCEEKKLVTKKHLPDDDRRRGKELAVAKGITQLLTRGMVLQDETVCQGGSFGNR
jgi:hypothetical protein